MNKLLLTFVAPLLFTSINIFGQEVLYDLDCNKQIFYKASNSYNARMDADGMLLLPITDDFSYNAPFPTDSIWADKHAFINNDFCIKPPTIGVATLDALDHQGKIYAHASSSPFQADFLTSKPIRLDSIFGSNPRKLLLSDSIYFSFYYQPQGNGNAPEEEDSLVLEFLKLPPDTIYVQADTIVSPTDTIYIPASKIVVDRWTKVWGSEGMTYSQFKELYQVDFKHVMIPVLDTAYLKKGFRFRFRNYASVANNYEPSWASNCDQWNIDYVYLNMQRSYNNTAVEDVAFTQKLTSLLKNYSAMPWQHFKVQPTQEMQQTINIPYRNLSGIQKNINRRFRITEIGGTSIYNYSGGNLNIDPYGEISFSPLINYTFQSAATNNVKFLVQCIINTTPDLNRYNDTVKYIQNFSDYYAYDDGSPEFGYGLTPSNAKIAYKYHIKKLDTLSAIDIYFNNTRNNANQKYFTLYIWKSIFPEKVLYKKAGLKPIFEDSLNAFHRYIISDSLLLVNDTIYIGIKQNGPENLNIGFDINSDASKNIFYNVDGTWNKTMYNGALLIRPVFGNSTYVHTRISNANIITPYPNPLKNGYLYIELPENIKENLQPNDIQVSIYSIVGNLLYTDTYKEQYDVSFLNNGVFIIQITDRVHQRQYTQKLLIAR